MWLLLVGTVAVIYPVFRLFPRYRYIHSTIFINDAYQRVMAIEVAATHAKSPAELQPLIDELDRLEQSALATLMATELIGSLYNMRNTLNGKRAALVEQLAKMSA
jgi:hypothetical protein